MGHMPVLPTMETVDTPLLAAAQSIYNLYQQVHGAKTVPAGVAVNRQTLRGYVLFNSQPVLLPHECFIPYDHLPEVTRL
ncbi:MAG TPA: hypothetical protein IGP91_07310 [Thermosynechococcus sp. M46_R2017_013]|nr:hypothetical protein [Thermosynechococcus sp. M46_R2017_013]